MTFRCSETNFRRLRIVFEFFLKETDIVVWVFSAGSENDSTGAFALGFEHIFGVDASNTIQTTQFIDIFLCTRHFFKALIESKRKKTLFVLEIPVAGSATTVERLYRFVIFRFYSARSYGVAIRLFRLATRCAHVRYVDPSTSLRRQRTFSYTATTTVRASLGSHTHTHTAAMCLVRGAQLSSRESRPTSRRRVN